MWPLVHSATVSELPQRELTRRNPFAALDACLRMIRVADGRRSITDVQLYESKLGVIFPKVMDMVCGEEGGDPQAIVDTVYDVCPLHPPRSVD